MAAMDADDERTIFNEALGRASSAARAAYLDHACAGRRAVRARVEALLAGYHRAGDFLEIPPPGLELGSDVVDATAAPAAAGEGPER